MKAALLQIEIVYAEPAGAILKTYGLDAGARVADALDLAARDPEFNSVDLTNAAVGIFGRLVKLEQSLQSGDRIEIYRRLAADPKTARRARVKQARRAGDPSF